jgi:hypothetical protein
MPVENYGVSHSASFSPVLIAVRPDVERTVALDLER